MLATPTTAETTPATVMVAVASSSKVTVIKSSFPAVAAMSTSATASTEATAVTAIAVISAAPTAAKELFVHCMVVESAKQGAVAAIVNSSSSLFPQSLTTLSSTAAVLDAVYAIAADHPTSWGTAVVPFTLPLNLSNRRCTNFKLLVLVSGAICFSVLFVVPLC